METKKSLAFYCCSNGLGHYKRVSEVAKNLTDSHDITIYCTEYQKNKIGPVDKAKYVFYSVDNIRWGSILKGNYDAVQAEYFSWLSKYGPTVKKFDIVISDNIVGLLKYRSDIILMGSFFWKDVIFTKIGTNEISTLEEELLNYYEPTLITNKYVETQSVTGYSNKIQTGFGCIDKMKIIHDIKYFYYQASSDDYGVKYSKVVDKIAKLNTPYIKSGGEIPYQPEQVAIIARPGVGTITHCVENYIPLIALYSDEDSQEIKELAAIVENLNIGFSQKIEDPVDEVKFKKLKSNTNFLYTDKLEKNGYENISKYIKSL